MTRPRVVYYTSGLSPCGVASYQRHVADQLDTNLTLETIRWPTHRILGCDWLGLAARRRDVVRLARQARGAAGILVDYTDTFFNGSRPGENLFPLFLRALPRPPLVVLHERPGRSDPPDAPGPKLWRGVYRVAHLALAARDTGTLRYEQHLRTQLFARAAQVVTHTPALAVPAEIGLPPERVRALPAPVYPLAAPALDRAAVDARFGLMGRRVIVMLGLPQPSKGFDRAIAALPHLPADVVLVQVGDAERCAPESVRLQTLAESIGASDRYLPAGPLSDGELAAVLLRADVSCVPFRDVQHSSSLGHLISAGAPIVASRIPGLVPVEQAGAGMLFADCDNPLALAHALKSTLQPGAIRAELVAKNQAYSAAHSFRTVAETLARLALA